MLHLTTTDSAILSKYLQRIDNAWIKGNLYFLGGKLLTSATIKYNANDLATIMKLTKDGIVADGGLNEKNH